MLTLRRFARTVVISVVCPHRGGNVQVVPHKTHTHTLSLPLSHKTLDTFLLNPRRHLHHDFHWRPLPSPSPSLIFCKSHGTPPMNLSVNGESQGDSEDGDGSVNVSKRHSSLFCCNSHSFFFTYHPHPHPHPHHRNICVPSVPKTIWRFFRLKWMN